MGNYGHGFPEGLKGPLRIAEMTDDDYQEAHLKLLMGIRQESIRQNQMLKNHSMPFDEFFNAPDPVLASAGPFEIQPDFATECRIESILVSLPVGITLALLELGRERQIILYSGAATTVQTLVNFRDLGIIVSENDRRLLTLAGVMTTGFHIELMGHALVRNNSHG